MAASISRKLHRPPQHGLRWTRQRVLISEIFFNQEHPVSLETLHQLVIEQDPEIAFSTVFRWMRMMEEGGFAASVEIARKSPRYYSIERNSAVHFYCSKCDTVYPLEAVELATRKLVPRGTRMESYSLLLRGICEICVLRERR